jgi:hypothetical protein
MNYHVSYLKCIFELGLNTQLSFLADCNVAGNYISAQRIHLGNDSVEVIFSIESCHPEG